MYFATIELFYRLCVGKIVSCIRISVNLREKLEIKSKLNLPWLPFFLCTLWMLVETNQVMAVAATLNRFSENSKINTLENVVKQTNGYEMKIDIPFHHVVLQRHKHWQAYSTHSIRKQFYAFSFRSNSLKKTPNKLHSMHLPFIGCGAIQSPLNYIETKRNFANQSLDAHCTPHRFYWLLQTQNVLPTKHEQARWHRAIN